MRVILQDGREEFVDQDGLKRRCQICGRRIRMQFGGRIGTHWTKSSGSCSGSGKPPWDISDEQLERELEFFADQVAADDRRAERIRLGTDNEPPSPYFELHRRYHRERHAYLARRMARSQKLASWEKL